MCVHACLVKYGLTIITVRQHNIYTGNPSNPTLPDQTSVEEHSFISVKHKVNSDTCGTSSTQTTIIIINMSEPINTNFVKEFKHHLIQRIQK